MARNNFLTAFVYDSELRIRANQNSKNYWYEYIKEINDQIGLYAHEISPRSLEERSTLDGVGVLFIGDLKSDEISERVRKNIDEWVSAGGLLIGFNTEGLDQIFGNSYLFKIKQVPDEYSISGYFSLVDEPITSGIHSCLHPEQKLIIISDIRCLLPKESSEVAHLYDLQRRSTPYPAITKRIYGKGLTYYFAFNVPQTIWILHQGVPISYDRDGDGYYRTGDMIAIGDNNCEVLYADEIIFLLQKMLSYAPQPLIYQLPSKGGEVPDVLLFWGGDDEAAKGTQVWASNWMKGKGLPYHINVMRNADGQFTLTMDELKAITDNGHEVSLHYNFIDNFSPREFSEADVKEQMDAFYSNYGFYPITTVNHWVRWTGWVDTAKWLLSAGGKADNSFIHHPFPPLNPTNRTGFAFGTSFPFHFYDDYSGNNARLNFIEEPITAYEVGYVGNDVVDVESIHKAIDLANRYHLTMNMFYHPINVYSNPACRQAIEEVLRYIGEMGIVVVHMGNDELWEWWSKRAASKITDVNVDGKGVRFLVDCAYKDGLIIKISLRDYGSSLPSSHVHPLLYEGCRNDDLRCFVDNEPTKYEIRRDFGQSWLYVIVPYGIHQVSLEKEGDE